ncbi:HEAT repeat domain-containing protein [Halobium palmae]|uniref:HEAT repeat domain-containing protein n=1 Tax=Halobium palmae TaxID=1776492 RepID=A0ABD5RWN5_9EURY
MEESDRSPLIEDLLGLIEEDANEEASIRLEELDGEDAEDRKRVLQALRRVADDDPTALSSHLSALTPFLTDDERSIRLTTAKLFVAVAEANPDAVVPVCSALADRLADEDEFYYVRARSAEALGYVALEQPEAVASPDVLADLRIGLSFDEPEVKEKLAKALEFVALGNPRRLRHQVSNLAEQFDDENELVRYHLCTAVAVVGCEYPDALGDARAGLVDRLDDENAFVRGRAAEALGSLERTGIESTSIPEAELASLADDEESFVTERARFVLDALDEREGPNTIPAEVGTAEGIRRTTDHVVEEITSPDGDGECPHCGIALPERGPPMCPRCGAPY